MRLNAKQSALCEGHSFDFSGLSALFFNCTLKSTGQLSHTEKLMEVSLAIMEANGVRVKRIRAVDYELPPGVYPDMRVHGFERDDWPELCKDVMSADILVMGTPSGWARKALFADASLSAFTANSASSMIRASLCIMAALPDASSPATRMA